jgi:ATP/maltotriose-dependent transcriptional regulator MalT
MKTFSRRARTGCVLTLAATAALLVAGTAAAAGAKLSPAQQRYQQERAVCLSGQSNQDRATCLKEAGAALHEARRGGLDTGDARDLGQNRMIRCSALPAQDREDCARRMHGEGVTSGSAQQGGVLHELSRPVAPN